LNPKKCIFGVPSGILLGNVISRDGIRPNPEKVQAVLNMKRPVNVKDVQKLTGCMVALSQFLSRFGDKGLPFFKLLKAGKKFEWSEEADIAFTQLKQYLASPLVLTAPKSGEVLQLYIAATDRVVSTILVVEREEPSHAYGIQRPIYFISEVLNESKTRYSQIQKLIYTILITTQKLKHYFDGFHMVIKTEFPLSTIIRNKDANGRIAKWAMVLCPFDLEFARRDTIKSQTLAEFMVQWTDLSIPTSQGPVHY
jgi:hypothetical protein